MKLPQLTLRDLFWLVLLVAMALGWWINQARLTNENKELEEALTPLEAYVTSLQESMSRQEAWWNEVLEEAGQDVKKRFRAAEQRVEERHRTQL